MHVSADELLFDNVERGPDADLRLHFEAIATFSHDEKLIVIALLEALILRHQAHLWQSASSPDSLPNSDQSTVSTNIHRISNTANPNKSILAATANGTNAKANANAKPAKSAKSSNAAKFAKSTAKQTAIPGLAKQLLSVENLAIGFPWKWTI